MVTDERKWNPIRTTGPPQVAISQSLLGRNAVDRSVSIDHFRWLHRWRGRTGQGSVEGNAFITAFDVNKDHVLTRD